MVAHDLENSRSLYLVVDPPPPLPPKYPCDKEKNVPSFSEATEISADSFLHRKAIPANVILTRESCQDNDMSEAVALAFESNL